ncbi:UNVERIFIED_CONTAM: Peroxisomal membrane protein PEX14 [Sesamum latifolium]|uniref:Peroxisomal membrane protein PEX14 n=1 Tax=Sesamum latifolium TaxID=2727402 RepID=A0AAW2UYJ1_9LAMI
MAAPADAPPSSAHQTPAVEQRTVDDRRGSKVEVVKESYPSSVFVNSEPIREEQVQNAVKFLSHPKVRGSPVIHRRAFLERKGLTKEEIDEAFRRVPDPTPSVQTTEPVVTNRDVQTQVPTQVLQSNPVLPAGGASKLETDSRFRWSYAILAVGFLAVSGAGTVVLFKNAIIPRLKSWIRKVASEDEDEEVMLKKNNGKPSIAEEGAAAAKVAAAAAADVAEVSRQMLATKSEEKKCFEELMGLLNAQVHELKSMRTAIQMLEGGRITNGKIVVEQHNDQRFLGTSSMQPYANGKTVLGSYSARSSSRPTPADPSVAPHPKYMEEINDTPPNPNQPLSNPRLAPRPKYLPCCDAEAAAIRQPKKPSYQKEQTTDNQLLAPSPDVTDELQRITRIPEAGGTTEANGKTSVLSSSDEIQAEENSRY